MHEHPYRRSRHLARPRATDRSALRRLFYVGAPLARTCPPAPWSRLLLAWLRGFVLRLFVRALVTRPRGARVNASWGERIVAARSSARERAGEIAARASELATKAREVVRRFWDDAPKAEEPPPKTAPKRKRMKPAGMTAAQRSEMRWKEPPRARDARIDRRALPRSGKRGR